MVTITRVGVGGKITASLQNQLVFGVNEIALTGIIPTAVEGNGVTVTPNGQVTFINTTAVSLDGVFTGSYDAYRIVVQSNNRSSASSTQFHLRASGNDVGTGYLFTKTVTSGTTATVSSSTSGSATPLDDGLAVGQFTIITMDLVYPAVANPTLGSVTSTNMTSTAMSSCQIGIANSSTGVADGFSMYPLTANATWSGILRVYGYNTLI